MLLPLPDALTRGVMPRAYYPNLSSDISWNAGFSGVADIQAAFNYARSQENSQLGTSLSNMSLPSQAEWDLYSNGKKALWLINQERTDRGLAPLHGLETNVTSVAQYYADYLLDNDTSGHYADGKSPSQRLDANPVIGACREFIPRSENIVYFGTSGNSIPLPIERSVYMCLYEDACASWGHREAILYYPYNDNSGPAGMEGFLGIGRASGGPYQGPFPSACNHAEIIVMNVFDPCADWEYGASCIVPPILCPLLLQ